MKLTVSSTVAERLPSMLEWVKSGMTPEQMRDAFKEKYGMEAHAKMRILLKSLSDPSTEIIHREKGWREDGEVLFKDGVLMNGVPTQPAPSPNTKKKAPPKKKGKAKPKKKRKQRILNTMAEGTELVPMPNISMEEIFSIQNRLGDYEMVITSHGHQIRREMRRED